jgi:hypothetical protein
MIMANILSEFLFMSSMISPIVRGYLCSYLWCLFDTLYYYSVALTLLVLPLNLGIENQRKPLPSL